MKEEFRPRLSKVEYDLILTHRKKHEGNILVVGDLHSPFIKEGYLEFCQDIYDKHNCSQVVFIGDLIDNHYSSYHETDPDGLGAGEELDRAIFKLQEWEKVFPSAQVLLGNHDLIPQRKGATSGLSRRWIRTIEEVLDFEGWVYSEEYYLNGILFVHGTGRKARNRCKDDLISIIQGHYHSESYIEHYVGRNYKLFAMQVGCGVDRKAYAMAYGRKFKKMHINCGVIKDNGNLPLLEYMPL